MKKISLSFLFGFSFYVTRWLFDVATTNIAEKPFAWVAYLMFPILILLFAATDTNTNVHYEADHPTEKGGVQE